MTVTELDAIFKANKVPHAYYSFRGMAADDCYVVEEKDGCWQSSYSERGSRYQVHLYPNEDTACHAMFALVAEMMLASRHQAIDIRIGA